MHNILIFEYASPADPRPISRLSSVPRSSVLSLYTMRAVNEKTSGMLSNRWLLLVRIQGTEGGKRRTSTYVVIEIVTEKADGM